MSSTLHIFSLIILINTTLLGQQDSPCNCTIQQTIGVTGEETQYSTLYPFSSSRCYFIKGTLVIDIETEEVNWDGLRIEMEEGAQILVKSDFSMWDCYIAGCDVMWKGIKLEEDVDFFSYNCYIQAAEIAIYVTNCPGFVCRNTHFIDNFIGIGAGSPF